MKNLEDKVSALEKSLADERKRVEVLELESNKLFEAEEQLVIVKDENETLRESLALKEVCIYSIISIKDECKNYGIVFLKSCFITERTQNIGTRSYSHGGNSVRTSYGN